MTVGDSPSGESLLQEADRSMFAAKRGGRGRIDVYSEAWGTIAADQLAVHAALAEGLQRGELLAYYQPIVDLRSGAVTAREALVRWAHPQRGLLGPASFLGGADRSPLGVALGEKVLELACAAAATWADSCAVHVNVSARHLAEPGFVAFVEKCLGGRGAGAVPAGAGDHREPGARRVALHAASSTAALSGMGVGLCLDDFGTGYSSVTALHKLPIGGFKIDRSFVTGVPGNATSASLVDGLISLGTGMGLDVVAEGVETREQAEWLAAHGCPSGQGFLFGRPVEACPAGGAVRPRLSVARAPSGRPGGRRTGSRPGTCPPASGSRAPRRRRTPPPRPRRRARAAGCRRPAAPGTARSVCRPPSVLRVRTLSFTAISGPAAGSRIRCGVAVRMSLSPR